ncbi:MAG TPA: NAD-dependent epimerase/dehydratase family protein [bacterium]|nr:NAD-dependent epimerase/dehydratase family protein [bacterium]
MKVLITGATGLVGSNLAERLSAEGSDEIRVLVRKESDLQFLKTLARIEFCYGDIRQKESLAAALAGVDAVYHCAAYVSDWASRDEMYDINVNGLRNMMDAALSAKVKRFVYVSSMVVLGMDAQHNLDELAPYVHTGDNYNYTKIEAEKLAIAYAVDKDLPIAILRPPYIYGPRDRQLLPRILKYLKNGQYKYIDGGNNPFNLVYVGNLVSAMIAAARAEKAAGQIYHITDGQNITRRQLVELICDVLGYKRPQKSVPIGVARVVAGILEGVNKLLGIKTPPILNKFRIKFMYTPLTFNIAKARRELGYCPKPFAQCMTETLTWYKKAGLEPA